MQLLKGKELHQIRVANLNRTAPTLVCDNLKSDENTGSFIRLADCFGSKSVIFLNDQKKSKYKTACSTENVVDFRFINSTNFIENKLNIPLIAVDLTDKSINLTEFNFPKECYLLFGNEGRGISSQLLEHCDFSIQIPMWGLCNSMNVAHSASVCLYEWRKQYEIYSK